MSLNKILHTSCHSKEHFYKIQRKTVNADYDSIVCEAWLPFYHWLQIQLWSPHNAMQVASFMFQVIQRQNLSQESVPVKGITFKFLRAGSRDDGDEVCLERLCDLFSICDATCELNWVLLVKKQIVALHLLFLWVNSPHLKQDSRKNYVQGRTDLKFERSILNIEIETSTV